MYHIYARKIEFALKNQHVRTGWPTIAEYRQSASVCIKYEARKNWKEGEIEKQTVRSQHEHAE